MSPDGSPRERLELDAPLGEVRLLAHGSEAVRTHHLERARAEGELAGRQAAGLLLDEAAKRLVAQEEEARAALARTASALAVDIARTLLRSEIADGAYDLERIVRETLGVAAAGRSPCVVHLNPVDHAQLANVRFRSGTKLEPDPGVTRGDVHVETSLGLLVRDLDSCLQSIRTQLQEELG